MAGAMGGAGAPLRCAFLFSLISRRRVERRGGRKHAKPEQERPGSDKILPCLFFPSPFIVFRSASLHPRTSHHRLVLFSRHCRASICRPRALAVVDEHPPAFPSRHAVCQAPAVSPNSFCDHDPAESSSLISRTFSAVPTSRPCVFLLSTLFLPALGVPVLQLARQRRGDARKGSSPGTHRVERGGHHHLLGMRNQRK